ncbi:Sec-independent protein translocase subunit TatA [Cellulosimicrobium sp. SH8]|uniref:Sec-independent protein translocase subunit TatA n=1 Tax=Cellulosimicrobium sp. SH8 TaxID=2952936 RepID=UPI0021F2B513|nr:Sec-independent protein translocase subunit TatA [Cellulosimicrobium sp. SH8]
MGMLKPWHIIVLVVVILLLFGARRLPDLAKSVGQSLKIFKSEVKDLREDDTTPPAAGGAGTTSASTGTSAPTVTGGTTSPEPGDTSKG